MKKAIDGGKEDMKSILLIGLGRFGRHIAIKLDELNHQVMAVDNNKKDRKSTRLNSSHHGIADGGVSV